EIEVAGEAGGERYVVGGAPGLQTVQQPKALLREGERRRPLVNPPRDHPIRRRCFRRLLPQTHHQKRELLRRERGAFGAWFFAGHIYSFIRRETRPATG